MRKYIFIYLGIFLALAALIVGGAFVYTHTEHTDEYGYVHNAKDNGSEKTMNIRNTSVVDTSYENIDAVLSASYNFITYATPLINDDSASCDDPYITFRLQDGTGIYFSRMYSSTTPNGIYGEIDAAGIVTQDYGYVTINGMNIVYTEAPDSVSRDSKRIAEAVPEEYQNDGLYIQVTDGVVYLTISSEFNVNTRSHADVVYETIKSECNGMPVVILVNDHFRYAYGMNNAEVSANE